MTMTTNTQTDIRVADPLGLDPGTELPPIERVVSTRQLVQYAAVSRDFTPIHYDRDYARSANLDGVIIHGALKTSLFAQAIRDWFGDDARLLELSASYRGIDYPGEPLTIRGKVKERRREESATGYSGRFELTIQLELRNAAGEVTTPGSATVRWH